MRLPVALSWSGGKDSAMALHSLLRDPRLEVVALLTTVTEDYDRISMHGVRRELLLRQAASLGLPLEQVSIPPQCTNALYESRLAETIQGLQQRGVRHLAYGDIFLRDLRAYREGKLASVGAVALFPLWQIDTHELVARFVRDGFRGVTVCIDPQKLDESFLGRELDAQFLASLPPGVDPCGENGEFHTFVFDGPIFRTPILVQRGEIVERDSFVFCDLLPARKGEPTCLLK